MKVFPKWFPCISLLQAKFVKSSPPSSLAPGSLYEKWHKPAAANIQSCELWVVSWWPANRAVAFVAAANIVSWLAEYSRLRLSCWLYAGGTIRICLAKRLVDRWLTVQSSVMEKEITKYGTGWAGNKCCRGKSLRSYWHLSRYFLHIL
jgi:hypothetical protein